MKQSRVLRALKAAAQHLHAYEVHDAIACLQADELMEAVENPIHPYDEWALKRADEAISYLHADWYFSACRIIATALKEYRRFNRSHRTTETVTVTLLSDTGLLEKVEIKLMIPVTALWGKLVINLGKSQIAKVEGALNSTYNRAYARINGVRYDYVTATPGYAPAHLRRS